MAKKVSKNNPGSRVSSKSKRMLDGREVVPVKYFGRPVGHGIYMAGKVGDDLVRNADGKPLPLRDIGKIE